MSNFFGVLDEGFTFQAFIAAFTIVYISFMYLAVARIRKRRVNRDTRLKEAISSGLINNQVEGVDDLVNLYRGVTNSSDDDVSYKASVSRVLRRLLVSLATDPGVDHGKKLLKHKIKGLLSQIDQETPFAEMPVAERNLVIDTQNFIDNKELNAAKQKVNDLASLIEARHDAYIKLQNANRWSIPLAAIGLVLTLIFGVISLRG